MDQWQTKSINYRISLSTIDENPNQSWKATHTADQSKTPKTAISPAPNLFLTAPLKPTIIFQTPSSTPKSIHNERLP